MKNKGDDEIYQLRIRRVTTYIQGKNYAVYRDMPNNGTVTMIRFLPAYIYLFLMQHYSVYKKLDIELCTCSACNVIHGN